MAFTAWLIRCTTQNINQSGNRCLGEIYDDLITFAYDSQGFF